MLQFEKRDPFPIAALSELSRQEVRLHSAAVDAWLGLRVGEIEARLAGTGSRMPAPSSSGSHQNLWFGLEPQDLLTPYVEIREMLERIAPRSGETIVDLGAAYGRMGFVVARHFPLVHFEGYEFVGERVQEGNRRLEHFGADLSYLHHADLMAPSFRLPPARHYFIYDFGTDVAIEKILNGLRKLSFSHRFSVVARGRRTQYSIDHHHHWLKLSSEPGVKSYSIYDSVPETTPNASL